MPAAQAVNANTDLVYDIELIGFELPDVVDIQARRPRPPSPPARRRGRAHRRRGRALQVRGDMLWEERMDAARRYREAGNMAFEGGDPARAVVSYLAAISYIDDGMMAQLMGPYLDQSSDLKGEPRRPCCHAARPPRCTAGRR